MKILVTGGTGFIGHNIVKQLESAGNEVCVVDSATDYLGTICQEELIYLQEERSRQIQSQIHRIDVKDLCDLERIYAEFRPEILIHCAQYPRQKQVNENAKTASLEIMTGMFNLLQCSQKYQTRRFSFVSNSLVYGEYDQPVSENRPATPLGNYAVIKLTCELLLKEQARDTGMEWNILRPSAVYGPLANHFVDRITRLMVENIQDLPMTVEGENEIFDFTFVEDTAAGIVGAATGESNTNGKIYNVTHGTGMTYGDAARLVQKISKKGTIKILPSTGEYGRVRSGHCVESAANDYGWRAKIDRQQGFQRLYDWLNNSVYWSKKAVQ